MEAFVSHNIEETEEIAREFVEGLEPQQNSAVVVGLSGDLGSGKTAFVKCVAKALGIAEHVTSPTFVIQKIYSLDTTRNRPLTDQPFDSAQDRFSRLIHIDAYRLDSAAELLSLGFKEILADPSSLILIEWPECVQEALPLAMRRINFEFIDETSRHITFAN